MAKVYYDKDSDALVYESERVTETVCSDYPIEFYLDSKGITGFRISGFTGRVEVPLETQLAMKGNLSFNRELDIMSYGIVGAEIVRSIDQDGIRFTLDKNSTVVGMLILGVSGLCETVRFIPFFGVI